MSTLTNGALQDITKSFEWMHLNAKISGIPLPHYEIPQPLPCQCTLGTFKWKNKSLHFTDRGTESKGQTSSV